MPLPKPLEQFVEDIRQTAITLGLPEAIRLLGNHLPDGKAAKQSLQLLSGRLNEANINHTTKGILTTDEYLLEINKIRTGFFDLLNTLKTTDFEATPAGKSGPTSPEPMHSGAPKFVVLYDQRDEPGAKALNKQLVTLKRAGKLSIYNAWSSLKAGDPFESAKKEADEAAYLLLLISTNLIDDETGEMPWFDLALALKNSGKKLIPVYLNKFTIESSGLENLKALPLGGKTIADFANPDVAYAEIANELRRLL